MGVGSIRRQVIYLVVLVIFCVPLPGVSVQAQSAASTVIPQEAPVLFPAFTTVGFSIVYEGDDNENGAARVEYRNVGEALWREGHPGMRIWHATSFSSGFSGSQDEWASRLFHLEPGTAYEVRVTFTDPDGVSGENPKVFSITTSVTLSRVRMIASG